MSENHLTSRRFDELDLPDSVLQGVRETKFEYCTPIQAETLPIALQGRDVAGQAQTGTGKTAAFFIAALAHLEKHPPDEKRKPTQPRTLILSPTRELAIQIHKDAVTLASGTDHKICLVYGGTGYEQQRQSLLDGVDILIVRGQISNVSKEDRRVPMIQVVLYDGEGEMVQSTVAAPLKNRLPPGTSIGFSAKLPEPSALARRLEVTFSEPKKTGG